MVSGVHKKNYHNNKRCCMCKCTSVQIRHNISFQCWKTYALIEWDEDKSLSVVYCEKVIV